MKFSKAMNIRGCHSEYNITMAYLRMANIDMTPNLHLKRSSDATEDVAASPTLRYPYHITHDSINAFYLHVAMLTLQCTCYILKNLSLQKKQKTTSHCRVTDTSQFGGLINTNGSYSIKETYLVIGKIKHSYAISKSPLHSRVIIKLNGTVIFGHCTCMAGLGETCSHSGALLFWV